MGIPQEHAFALDPMGDNNNHLSHWEYTEDVPVAERIFKRVETAERDTIDGAEFPRR